MKKIVLILMVVLAAVSCNSEDNNGFEYEVIPVESAVVPSEMTVNTDYSIAVSFRMPSACHAFSDFFYEVNEDTRTVAVVAVYSLNGNCSTQVPTDTITRSFVFRPLYEATYLFRFWNGADDQDIDIYTEYEVEATNAPG
jgi:hypothetical protein